MAPMPADADVDALLDDLTPEQRQAVTATDGPVLILAGAGSGKTRVLTRRIAYLIAQGVEPSSVLAITFTNKAAGEMRGRVEAATGRRLRDFGRLVHDGPTICTFHSLCLRILRHYGDILGVPRNFNIYDTADQNRLMKSVLKDLDISSTNFPPGKILATISNVKNALTTASDFAAAATDFYQKTVARAYTRYEAELLKNEAMDFDDLILRTVHGLRDRPDVLRELQERFSYIHIDEYQDTNRAQYVLAHVLADAHKNLCVVGDPDQSIYAWRGADLRNILDFEGDYPSATVVRLERNYRSTAAILALADALIANNTERKEKKLVANTPGGEPATLLLCQDEQDEAREVTSLLMKLKNETEYEWSDMAVFYRMNSLTRVMEDALRREKVPYQIARGTEFYNRKEIKDALAYLRLIANPRDEVSLTRIVNTPPRGISDASVKSLQAFAVARGVGLWEAMRRADECGGLNDRAKAAVGRFVQQVTAWRSRAPLDADTPAEDDDNPLPSIEEIEGEDGEDLDMFAGLDAPQDDGPQRVAEPASVRELLERVVAESGLEAYLHKTGGDEKQELANVGELITGTSEFDDANPGGTLHEYLHGVALVSDAEHMRGGGGSVTLMTLHAAKGLEFPVVSVIGWEDGCLPHSRARDNLSELEEERRLAFVGITRAERRLILSRATYRTVRGVRERTIPSGFLAELPPEHIEVVDRTGLADLSAPGHRDEQRSHMQTHGDKLANRFRAGQRVRHAKFGAGRVIEVSGGTNAKAVIDFAQGGRKTLVLDIAARHLSPLG